MRTLLLLRGAPGCGKSTFIETNGLKHYTLSADDLRLLCQSPQQTPCGEMNTSMTNDKFVWKTLFDLLEIRMRNGEFTVIDATNSRTEEMNRYRTLAESYRYRTYCIDFTDLDIDECKNRNLRRPSHKQVPEEVIDKMYARFHTQKIPGRIKVLKPDELDSIWIKQLDFSGYRKVVHVGDIHGCYTALMEYFKDGLEDDCFYIFVGDYVDRGIENAETMNFLFSITDKKNVLLLEGNHERWLWMHGNGETARSKEFELRTKKQFENAGLDPKLFRMFYRKLGQCAWYRYSDKEVFVSHGGVATIPQNLTLMATSQIIGGVGKYEDFETIADTWMRMMPGNCYQIHGHRNPARKPMRIRDRVFNLENDVEFGGNLRILELGYDGFKEVEIKNTVFRATEEREQEAKNWDVSVADVVLSLRTNKYVQEKKFGSISSFNFTRDAFLNEKWNEQTIKARGLYIDIEKMKVVARSYDKFFNIGEQPFTRMEALKNSLLFPVTVYVKENGYLGIISYDERKDDLFVTTKSNPEGKYAEWLREMITDRLSSEQRKRLKDCCEKTNVSFVFEVVNTERDPHIIEYDEPKLFLLAVVKNAIKFEQLPYEDLIMIAESIGVKAKEQAAILKSWEEFYDWYIEVTKEGYIYCDHNIEGFVVEDPSCFMAKIKLPYYLFWKKMRGVARQALRQGYITNTGKLWDALSNEFYGFLKDFYEKAETKEEKENLLKLSIIDLRKMFYAEK